MDSTQILEYINKNIIYTKTNGLYLWSDWHDFKPENKRLLLEIKTDTFFIEFNENKFRIKTKII